MTDNFPLLHGASTHSPPSAAFTTTSLYALRSSLVHLTCPPAAPLRSSTVRRQSRSSTLTRASPPGEPVKTVVDYSPCCLFVRIRFLPSTMLFHHSHWSVHLHLGVLRPRGRDFHRVYRLVPRSDESLFASDEPALTVRLRGNGRQRQQSHLL
jgi:hypothetical protein